MKREHKVVLVVVYGAEELIEKDLLRGPKLLTEEGRAEARRLREGGFIPTLEEAKEVMASLFSTGAVETPM